jgi:hypothetical protein
LHKRRRSGAFRVAPDVLYEARMKKNNKTKHLSLNPETLRALDSTQLDGIAGGRKKRSEELKCWSEPDLCG